MFLLLVSVLLQSALAEPNDMECPSPYVLFSTPSTTQMNVPVDVQPAVYMSNDDCAAPSYYELVLSTDDVIVKSSQVPWERDGERLLELDLEDALQPGTSYTLSIIAGDGWVLLPTLRTGCPARRGLMGVRNARPAVRRRRGGRHNRFRTDATL